MDATEFLRDHRVPASLPNALRRGEDGHNNVFRAPSFEELSDKEYFSLFEDRVWLPNSVGLPPRYIEYEMGEKAKNGPTSPVPPFEEKRQKVEAYFSGFNIDQVGVLDEYGIVNDLPSAKLDLRLLALSEAKDLLHGNTNSGFPFFARKRLVRDQLLELALHQSDPCEFPCILFNRSVQGGPLPTDVNARVVWGFPGSNTIVELSLLPAVQLLEHSHQSRAAVLGPEPTTRAVQAFIAWCRETGSVAFSTDFSGFDTSFGPSLMRKCLADISIHLQPKFASRVEWIAEGICNIPLLCTRNEVFSGAHAMPSGTGVTNDLGSHSHRYGQLLQAAVHGGELNPYCQIQGDDGLLAFTSNPTPEAISDVWKLLGFVENAEKMHVSYDDCVYLRRWYEFDRPEGWYPVFRAANSLRFQHRWYDEEGWGPEMVIIRALHILQNCASSPLFTALVDFAMDADKFRLGAAWPGGLDALINGETISRAMSTVDLFPSYNGARSVRGIRSWDVFKYIRERGN